MSKNRGYSNEFQLSVLPAGHCCQEGLICEVRYADGQVRKIGYDANGVPNCFVDTDELVWSREEGTNYWTSNDGQNFYGTIEVVPQGSKESVAGSISIRFMNDGFVVTERIFFPIGIVVESHFTRDRTELERHVRLLNGKQLQFRREGRGGLWFRQDGDVAHQPENPFHFGLPWRYPAVALMLA
jgi:hypothetical protein